MVRFFGELSVYRLWVNSSSKGRWVEERIAPTSDTL